MTRFGDASFPSKPYTEEYASGWDRIWGGARGGDEPEPASDSKLGRGTMVPAADPPAADAPVDELHAWLDRAMGARQLAQGLEPACGRGCSDCCQQVVGVFEWEADRLVEAVEALPLERLEAVRERLDELLGRLTEDELGVMLTWPPPDKARLTWREAEVMCPLNDPSTGACLVWSARPSVCRLYNVVNGPEGVCDVPGARGVGVPFLDLLEEAARLNGAERTWLPLALSDRL